MVDPKSMKKWALSSALAGVVLTAPLTGYAALGDQTLKQGMSHNDVKQLQNVLKDKGYFTYSTSTGYFGPITRDAVMQFQKEANLSVDGIAGPMTFKALNISSSPTPKEPDKSAQSINTNQLLRVGSRGQAVTDLQNKLQSAGLYTYAVDGIYGSRTALAVRQFQQQKGLQVDGIAGPKTLAALNGVPASKQPPEQTSPNKPAPNNDAAQILRFGARGSAVTDLQNKLKTAGVFPYTVDGIFGKQTETAVRNFQLRQGLTVDGIAGPKTLAKLQSPNSSGKPGNNASFNVIQLVAHAGKLMGTPYVWGGTTTSGFDCSGFLVYVFNKQGVKLPRTVAQQWNAGKKVSQPSVGDVVFFETYKSGPSHNGIYVGNNQFIHSGSSTGVTISNLNSSYWKSRYLGAKQLY